MVSKADALVFVSKDVGLEVNADESIRLCIETSVQDNSTT